MDLSEKQIIDYLNSDGKELFTLADKIRKEQLGDRVYLRGLVEISNICKRNCYYCGIRNENKNCKRYRLTPDEIKKSVELAVELGYKTIVMQSGEDDFYTADKLKDIIKFIKDNDMALTLSFGEKSYEEYAKYKDYGADRYLLRIETTDKNLYKSLHPNMDFENRINCLKNLKKLGFEVGTGIIVGLPNQTIESIAKDILFFKEIQADMIGVGPLLPAKNTPLKDEKKGDLNLTLKVMALTRVLLENVNIPSTTALETLTPNGRILGLQCGANVVMPNVTDIEHKKLYSIYTSKSGINQTAKDLKSKVEQEILSIGRFVENSKGFRKKI